MYRPRTVNKRFSIGLQARAVSTFILAAARASRINGDAFILFASGGPDRSAGRELQRTAAGN